MSDQLPTEHAILATIAELRAATAEYREATAAATEAACAQWRVQRRLEAVEATVRMEATSAVVGASEKRSAPERDALIAHCIATHPTLGAVRAEAAERRERVEETRARTACAEQEVRSLRAQLAALTALCGGAA